MAEGGETILGAGFSPVTVYCYDKLGLRSASGGQLSVKEASSRRGFGGQECF